MVSVTQRIKQIKQPRGGYLPVKTFTVTTLDDGQVLNGFLMLRSLLRLVWLGLLWTILVVSWMGQLLRRLLRFPCLVLVP